MNRILVLLFAVCSLWLSTIAVASADVETMKHGLSLLSERRYADALVDFQKTMKANPSDVQARYCAGVCLHFLNRYAEAAAQYRWVAANAKDPELARRAQKGLAGVASLAASSDRTIASGTNAPAEMKSSGADFGAAAWPGARLPAPTTFGSKSSIAMPSAVQTNPTSWAAVATGTPKIVDVYTDWCGWCKKFAPIFDQAASHYSGRIAFERVNAESPEAESFMRDYKQYVRGYPSILYFDSSGNVKNATSGAPRTFEAFQSKIGETFPEFKE